MIRKWKARKAPRRRSPAMTICRSGVCTALTRSIEISQPVAVDLAWMHRRYEKNWERVLHRPMLPEQAGEFGGLEVVGGRSVAAGDEEGGEVPDVPARNGLGHEDQGREEELGEEEGGPKRHCIGLAPGWCSRR